jgi:hypothetical protein
MGQTKHYQHKALIMDTALTLQLLQGNLSLPDLTIGQAIDIAHIPQEFNEKRLSAMITHLSGDADLAGRISAQERYYILLSHQAVTQHRYNDDNIIEDYLIETVQSDVPASYQVGDMVVQHLLGAHVVVLEGVCENVYEWLCGQMACQLTGDLSCLIGGEDAAMNWQHLPATMTDAELNQAIQERVRLIGELTTDQFNDLVSGYNAGVVQLAHFVALGSENKGLTIIKQGGDGINEPARFLTLDHLHGAAAQLAKCVT